MAIVKVNYFEAAKLISLWAPLGELWIILTEETSIFRAYKQLLLMKLIR